MHGTATLTAWRPELNPRVVTAVFVDPEITTEEGQIQSILCNYENELHHLIRAHQRKYFITFHILTDFSVFTMHLPVSVSFIIYIKTGSS